MSTKSKSSLVLNTVSGVANTNRTSCTWLNIDLRMLLGDMYNKYDRFNLCLNTIAQSIETITFTSNTDSQCLIRLSGLPWINNSYNITTTGNNNTGFTIISSFQFLSSQVSTQYFYGSNMSSFSKNQDICNITIDYIKVYDLSVPSSTGNFPNMTFIFDIFGIDEFKTNSTERRIKI